jgi:hypothetical protein
MVVPPTPEEEDRRRRVYRERAILLQERIRHTNRIKGLLAGQGIIGFNPLHKDRRQLLDAARTGDGRSLPPHLKAEILREIELIELLVRQIADVEAAREALAGPESSTGPIQQRSRKCLAVDRIRLGAPPASRHGDGRRVDHMTFNAVCLQQPVDPKAVQSSFLDRHNLHRTPRQLLSPCSHALQQTGKRATIAARCRVLRHPVPFRQQAGDKPCRSTQFQ